MKKLFFALMMTAILALPGLALADGFTGPKVEAQTITIAQLSSLPDDSKVFISGKIVRSIGDEKYEFKDETGVVTVKIKDRLFEGITVSPEDTLVIYGELDKGYASIKVEAKRIDFKR